MKVSPTKIEVLEDGKINKITLVNRKKLPNTGHFINFFYLIISNFLAAGIKIYEKVCI